MKRKTLVFRMLLQAMSMQPREITILKDAIREKHGCSALYLRTVHAPVEFPVDPKWNGLVMVFELMGHHEAEFCYAWSYRDRGARKSVAVLKIPPVDSPAAAVKSALAGKQPTT
ncbi:MAG: hypothetical protein ACJ8HU_03090 [Chthoniobacterales bacterium]